MRTETTLPPTTMSVSLFLLIDLVLVLIDDAQKVNSVCMMQNLVKYHMRADSRRIPWAPHLLPRPRKTVYKKVYQTSKSHSYRLEFQTLIVYTLCSFCLTIILCTPNIQNVQKQMTISVSFYRYQTTFCLTNTADFQLVLGMGNLFS